MSEPSASAEELHAHMAARLREVYDLSFAEPPLEASEAEAADECDRLLRALGDVRAYMAENERLHGVQVSAAKHWLDRVNAPLARQEAWLLAMLKHVAPFVRYFGRRKSRDLPHGEIGTRLHPERIEIVDPGAAGDWARERGLPYKVELVVAHSTLTKAWKSSGKVPPGCRLVEATDEFYAKPLGVA